MTTKERAALVRKVERRTRAKYVKRCWLCFIMALLIGLAGGIYLAKWGPLKNFTDKSRSDVQATVTATIDPAGFVPEAKAMPDAEAAEATATPAVIETAQTTPAPVATATPAPVATEKPTEAPKPTATPVAAATPAPVVIASVSPEAASEEAATEGEPAATETADAPEEPAETAAADTPEEPTETGAADAPEAGETPAPEGEVEATTAPEGEVGAEEAIDADAEPEVVLGTIENPIPLGEAYEFESEIVQGGTPRYTDSMTEYETLSLSATVLDYLTPDYFAEKYSTKYKLQGNEAGAALSLELKESTGSEEINPQDALLVCFESETGAVSQGYQLMNAEIAGDYGVPLAIGEKKTYYKRFAYTSDPEMDFLTLIYYTGGQAIKVYFSLEPAVEPEPEPTPTPAAEEVDAAVEPTETPEVTVQTYTTIENGSRGDHVKALQERLIELGYLDDVADGIAGGNTASAISAAQAKAGMEVNGVADNDFQTYIFSDDAPKAGD